LIQSPPIIPFPRISLRTLRRLRLSLGLGLSMVVAVVIIAIILAVVVVVIPISGAGMMVHLASGPAAAVTVIDHATVHRAECQGGEE